MRSRGGGESRTGEAFKWLIGQIKLQSFKTQSVMYKDPHLGIIR